MSHVRLHKTGKVIRACGHQRNAPISVMHVPSCCFCFIKLITFSCRHEKLLLSSITRDGTELKKVAHTEVVDREYCLSGSQSSLLLVHSRYGSNTCSHTQKPTETYRVFSLTWPASMQIYWNKRKVIRASGHQRNAPKSVMHVPSSWFCFIKIITFHVDMRNYSHLVWPETAQSWKKAFTLKWLIESSVLVGSSPRSHSFTSATVRTHVHTHRNQQKPIEIWRSSVWVVLSRLSQPLPSGVCTWLSSRALRKNENDFIVV